MDHFWMRCLSLLLLTLRVSLSSAQTAPGFPVHASNPLGVEYATINTFIEVGDMIPEAGELYIVLMIDQDVPWNGSKTTFLHWLEPNVVRYHDLLLPPPATLPVSTGSGASYVAPRPPAGSGAHRYSFVLFSQPANFTMPDAYEFPDSPADLRARLGFDIADFVTQSNLGEAVAGNYLRVKHATSAT